MSEDLSTVWELVSVYTRANAIADGTLLDVTEPAREAGFRAPVALTHRVWDDCVAWSDEDERQKPAHQEQSGRLWDVLWMASLAARTHRDSNQVAFVVFRVPRSGKSIKAQKVHLECVCGPGDNGELVITIQFPGED